MTKSQHKSIQFLVALIILACASPLLKEQGLPTGGENGTNNTAPAVSEKMVEPKVLDAIDLPRDAGYTVTRVVDGDTLMVSKQGKTETVRLIGINTPETVDPRKAVECFGREASAQMKTLATGARVTLVNDPTQGERDTYKRRLAYVFRDDGLFLNEYLIQTGYGYEYTYDKPYTYQLRFREAETDARVNKRGLWNDNACN